MLSRGPAILACLCLLGCVAPDVGEEVKTFSTAVEGVEKDVRRSIGPDRFEAARLERLRASARNGDTWIVSEGCVDLESFGDLDQEVSCEIERIAFGDADLPVQRIDAIERKLEGLTTYMTAIVDLSSSETESDIKAAIGKLSKSANTLRKMLDPDNRTKPRNALLSAPGKVQATAEFAIAQARMAQLRKTVTASRDAVADLVQEIMDLLYLEGVDPQFARAQARMRAASAKVGDPDLTDRPEAYGDAIIELDAAHTAFVSAEQKSIYGKLRALARAHGALADRLSKGATPEDYRVFVKEIKALKATLEKDT